MSIDMTLQKWAIFIMGVDKGNFSFFVGSNWKFVPGYIKNVQTHHESFSSKKQVINKLSPKSLWQTYMKWTVITKLCTTAVAMCELRVENELAGEIKLLLNCNIIKHAYIIVFSFDIQNMLNTILLNRDGSISTLMLFELILLWTLSLWTH